jgi:hypothetical protein
MYRHTQTGYLMLLACAVAFVFLLVLLPIRSPGPVGVWLPLVVLGLVAFVFGSLTTEVGPQQIRIWFGPGLIRRSFALPDVASCTVVQNPWYYGWGIRKIPNGWLYNVSGSGGVELRLRNGGVARIGSDEPEALLRALLAFKGGSAG